LKVKSNGTLERFSNGVASATGTWTLEGTVFMGTYTYDNGTVVVVDGSVDKAQLKLVGSWENSGGEEGTFYANRDNQ
jgi:hypothetical protein